MLPSSRKPLRALGSPVGNC